MEPRIILFDQLESTNDTAQAGNYPEGSVIVARHQTAGRGQRGSQWESAPGENLTCSLVVCPRHVPADEQFRVSRVASLAAWDVLTQLSLPCRIKWPNDLYVGDRKVGGILIEHELQGAFLTRSIIGVGINARQIEFSPLLPNPTSIAVEQGWSPSPEELLDLLWPAFEQRYRQDMNDPGASHDEYLAALWRSEGNYPYRDASSGEEFEASIDAIDPHTGELTLCDTLGTLRPYWFKEVEAIL